MDVKIAKRIVVGAIAVILVLTILEFPAPIGFETRPQNNVSLWWLILFVAILISEIAAIPLIYKLSAIGAIFGILAAVLNILQIIADQTHMMQPEIAPLGYLILEDAVGIASLILMYFSWKIIKVNTGENK